jgi:hypothetical protein
MLQDLKHNRSVPAFDLQSVQYGGNLPLLKTDINNRSNYLGHNAFICHFYSPKAAEPEIISVTSWVMLAWRTLL